MHKVIYHANCPDGFCAAWVARQHLPADTVFIAAQYGDDPPEVGPDDWVYVLDFTYPAAELVALREACGKLVVLDHHKTGAECIRGLVREGDQVSETSARRFTVYDADLLVVFDLDKSGAMLAWRYFTVQKQPPAIVKYVQDRDLWHWHLANSRAINAYLGTLPHEFDAWDMAAQDLVEFNENFRMMGSGILLYQRKLVASLASKARRIRIGEHDVPAVNSSVLQSELGHALCPGEPFAVIYFQKQDGDWVFSLRSDADGLDVSEVAKAHGGGGHARAAGFRTSTAP